jgi:glycosyltransferase involved in cell wall biosynthesis
MKDKPLVTIVIPIRNRVDYLSESLRSILNQNYRNIEIILSDNGSHHNITKELISLSELDDRIIFRRNDLSVSMSCHFNQCLKVAKGKYFIIISDDDKISENFIEQFVLEFETNKEISIGMASTLITDNESTISDNSSWVFKERKLISGLDMLRSFVSLNEEFKMPTFISVFAKTSDLIKISGFPDFEGGGYADTALAIMLMTMGDVICIDTTFFYYRVYPTSSGLSMSHRKLRKCGKQLVKYFEGKREQLTIVIDFKFDSLKEKLVSMTYDTYYFRLLNIYNYNFAKRNLVILSHSYGFIMYTIKNKKPLIRSIKKILNYSNFKLIKK